MFPPRCVLCRGRPYASHLLVCEQCTQALDRERQTPSCPRCAATAAPYSVSEGRCQWCRHSRPYVAATVRVGPYHNESHGDGRDPREVSTLGWLIRIYKYGGREELGPVLGGWVAETVNAAPWRDRIEAVVAVPTHWRHRLGRPLYAAEVLARVVAKRLGLPLAPVLKRVRAGPHQIGLDYGKRKENVRGAFSLRRGVIMKDARLLLVDDVKTTGATLKECAKILRHGGAAEVYAAVAVTAGRPQSMV